LDKQKIAIIVLATVLFLTVQYLVLENWTSAKQEEIMRSYQGGYDKGLEDAVRAIYEQTQNCQLSTVMIGNLTKQVFDASCIENNSENQSP
jgi:hypothetical protein